MQTYTLNPVPDTIIDNGPGASSNSASATFTFHSTQANATFECVLDGSAPAPCTSPTTYSGTADGSHTFTVRSATSGGTDPTPASYSWSVDAQPPTKPTGLTATAPTAALVNLSWGASTDANGVTGYDVWRDGSLLDSVAGTATSYSDTSVSSTTTYQYLVIARDGAGNSSPASDTATVTTPSSNPPLFTDGFESGSLSAWNSSGGLTVQGGVTRGGNWAAQANTTNGNTYAKKTLSSAVTDGYSRIWFNVQSTSSQVNLLRHRTAADGSIAYLYLTAAGQLGLRNDVAAFSVTSSTVVAPGSGWHELEMHTLVNGTSSIVDVWLDGVRIDALSITTNLGTSAVGRIQIGDVQTGRTYNVAYDDVAFGTERVGP